MYYYENPKPKNEIIILQNIMKSISYFSIIFTTLFYNSFDDVSSTQNLFMFDTKANIFLCPQETKLGNDQFKKL